MNARARSLGSTASFKEARAGICDGTCSVPRRDRQKRHRKNGSNTKTTSHESCFAITGTSEESPFVLPLPGAPGQDLPRPA